MSCARAYLAAVAALLAVAVSCGNARETTRGGALAVLDALGAREPSLAAVLAPREDSFMREDGALVSAGWRAAAKKRFEGLGARLPDSAAGTIDVGASRFSALHVHVVLVGARAESTAQLDRGRVVYREALPHTDRVLAATDTRLEELLVLHDAEAPRTFTWNMHLPEGIARAVEHDGGLHFEDTAGRPKLVIPAPVAYDANGDHVPLTTRWNDATSALTLALPEDGTFVFPVVVDPIYDVSVWFDVSLRVPPYRQGDTMVFDSARSEVVLFGGNSSGTLRDDTWVWNGAASSWTLLSPPVRPAPRDVHAMVFDTGRGEAVLFGGRSFSGVLNDTWVWNGAAASWTQKSPASSPPARAYHAMAYDSARAEVVLFGGSTNLLAGATGNLGDTWVWNGASGTWTPRMPAASPSARAQHVMAFDAARGEAVLFGSATTNETWIWNGAASTWAQRSPTSSPSPRTGAAVAYDSVRREVVLFSGEGVAFYNDTWAWNGASSSWVQRNPSASPPVRRGHGMAFDAARGELVVFSGFDISPNFADTWTWPGGTSPWVQRSPTPTPPASYDHAMVYDEARGQVVLFGGLGSAGMLGQTWIWSGAAWSRRMPATSPPVRTSHAMAYDRARGRVVLFGGLGSTSTFLADTWTWDGTTWLRRTPIASPSARYAHALAFDAVRNEVVLFGGASASAELSETWVWDDVNWVRRTVAPTPSARTAHTLAFDDTRGETVLFGGINGADGALDDTWTWNGSAWTPRDPAVSPGAHSEHAVAFDATRGEVVMFGGNVGGANNDTWTWSATAWARRSPATVPSPRLRHAMAFDKARGEVVLFGGTTTGFLGDTWVHRTLGGTCSASANCLEGSFCVEGVCCNAPTCGSCATCAGTSPGRCAPVTNEEDPDTCALRDGKSCNRVGECKAALGERASTALDCASGHLVDGVCCASAECGPCEACDPALKEQNELPGICSAARQGTDPHDDCGIDEPTTCGRKGSCDGRRRCTLYGEETSCGPTSVCSGVGTCIAKEASCDGDHTVVSANGTRVDCAPYRCEGATCRDSCTNKSNCVGDADCTGEGKCIPFAAAQSGGDGCSCRAARSREGAGSSLALFAFVVLGARASNARVRAGLQPRRSVVGIGLLDGRRDANARNSGIDHAAKLETRGASGAVEVAVG